MKRWIVRLIVGLLVAGLAPQAGAADPEKTENLMFYFENDTFGGTDANYSNAVKVAWISEDLDEMGDADDYLPKELPLLGRFFSGPGYQRNLGISFGQNIFTPKDTDAEELVEDDRPYAGFTYLAFAIHRKNRHLLDTLELTLGIVGPASLAEETQNTVHEIIDSDKAQGWEHQLENEPGLALTFQRNWRLASGESESGWGWDFIPHLGATAGNVAVFANAGAGLRFGYHVPEDFGTGLIRPGGNVSAPAAPSDPRISTREDFGLFGFIRAEGRAVALDIFLDGNTWEESHSVDKNPLVGDVAAGIAFIYKALKLTYTHVYRTETFKEQRDAQTFGSVSLTVTY